MPDDTTAVTIRVVVDTYGIIATFAHEKPPVQLDDWDAQAYARERLEAYREALQRPLAVIGARLESAVDTSLGSAPAHGVQADDQVTVLSSQAVARELQSMVRQAVDPIDADASAWRRFLRPAWFERHRAWRLEAGSPIAH